jgi:hypothetical protein
MSMPDELAAFLDSVACFDFAGSADDVSTVSSAWDRAITGPRLPTHLHAPRGAGDPNQGQPDQAS